MPEEKWSRAINLLEEFADPSITKATVKQLQQLCGFLNFPCHAIVPGRAFTRRMYANYSNIVKIDGVVRACAGTGEFQQITSSYAMKWKQHWHVVLDLIESLSWIVKCG